MMEKKRHAEQSKGQRETETERETKEGGEKTSHLSGMTMGQFCICVVVCV